MEKSRAPLSLEEEAELIGSHVAPDEISSLQILLFVPVLAFLKRSAVRKYDMTHWYTKLGAETFRSIFIPLNAGDLRALNRANSANYRGSNIKLTADEQNSLARLVTRMDEAIASLGGQAFIKLNTRSPKDAVIERRHPKVVSLIQKRLDTLQQTDDAAYKRLLTDDNDQMVLILESASEAMKSESGAAALELLTNSSRIQTDVKADLRVIEDKLAAQSDLATIQDSKSPSSDASTEPTNLYLIAREWVPVPLSAEYRVFVCRGEVTAAAQYFHMCYWPHLAQQRQANQQTIKDYVTKIINTVIDYDNCVVDVALYNDRCYVIEINPFHFSTGAPMYGWKQGSEERSRLLYGPYELRVQEKPMEDAKQRFMATPWMKLFEERLAGHQKAQEEEEEGEGDSSQSKCTVS